MEKLQKEKGIGNMELDGKKVNFLGDSITYGHGVADPANRFVDRLRRECGLAEARNYGVNGTRFARQIDDARYPNYTETFIDRAARMEKDADLILVFGGTNDFGHGDAPFGTWEDRTDDTFCGACHVLFRQLIEAYPDQRIVILTPLHRLGEDNVFGDSSKQTACRPLRDYAEQIRKTAEYYALPLLDLYAQSGLQPDVPVIRERYMPDGLHPNDAGHEKLTAVIKAFLERI